MASEHSTGDFLLDALGRIAPMVAVLVASVAGWWAWRTSLLKMLSDRLAAVEAREETRIKEAALAQLRVGELTSELIMERSARRTAEAEATKWQLRYEARRERQTSNPGVIEDSEADALDDIAATRHDSTGQA